jgi:hypothetical protein
MRTCKVVPFVAISAARKSSGNAVRANAGAAADRAPTKPARNRSIIGVPWLEGIVRPCWRGARPSITRELQRSRQHGPAYPMNVSTVGAKNPKASRAAPITPIAALNQMSALIPVMMAADANTTAIWARPLPSS